MRRLASRAAEAKARCCSAACRREAGRVRAVLSGRSDGPYSTLADLTAQNQRAGASDRVDFTLGRRTPTTVTPATRPRGQPLRLRRRAHVHRRPDQRRAGIAGQGDPKVVWNRLHGLEHRSARAVESPRVGGGSQTAVGFDCLGRATAPPRAVLTLSWYRRSARFRLPACPAAHRPARCRPCYPRRCARAYPTFRLCIQVGSSSHLDAAW